MFNDTSVSNSVASGALRVAGGMGVAGALYAGSIQATPVGSINRSTGAFTTLAANSSVTINGTNAAIVISPTGTGTVTMSPASTLTLGSAGVNTNLLGAVRAETEDQTIVLSPTGNGTVTINPAAVGSINKMNIGAATPGTAAFTTLTADNAVTFTQNTGSTSTTSGTLVVTGGVGISERLYAGSIQNTPIGSVTRSTGAFTSIAANADSTITANTVSSSTATGALVVTGGVGVGGKLYANGIVTTTIQSTQGVTLSDGTNVDQLTVFNKSLTITTSWLDTGIKFEDLASGSYIMQVTANDSGVGGGHVNIIYTAAMTWYAGTTNETTYDEIVVNRTGVASGSGTLFFRLLRSTSADNLRLQVAGTTVNTGAATYTFKFRRIL